ncbi:hypothetical protein ACFQE7_27875 [Nonomuraea ferruginea]|uniref:hypothetical protein n=1 Tax=Nonomuraea ferruginea TaxID=46174 RepID=UPI00360884B8
MTVVTPEPQFTSLAETVVQPVPATTAPNTCSRPLTSWTVTLSALAMFGAVMVTVTPLLVTVGSPATALPAAGVAASTPAARPPSRDTRATPRLMLFMDFTPYEISGGDRSSAAHVRPLRCGSGLLITVHNSTYQA